jgi:putative pyruvate formate lyase activating enzyme
MSTVAFDAYERCELCPRRCRAHRLEGQCGRCGATSELRIARAALHYWEEPPISGSRGSGAIFFSGCPLRCVFCQNHEISQEGVGRPVSVGRLARIMLELQEADALNINLVTPLHFAPHVRAAIEQARAGGLVLPIVCNTSGYELPELVRALGDCIDVWLTDFKYASSSLAHALSAARDYPEVAAASLAVMVGALRAAGGRLLDEDGAMRRGIIVRHLVLP